MDNKETQTESRKASNWFSLNKKYFVHSLNPLCPYILNRFTYSCWKSYSRLVKKTHVLVFLLRFRFQTGNALSNNTIVNIICISWCYKSPDSSFSKHRKYTYDSDFLCNCFGNSSCTDCRSRIESSILLCPNTANLKQKLEYGKSGINENANRKIFKIMGCEIILPKV